MLFTNFIDLFLESAPWLLLGLVLAGMLKMFVPMSWMQKQLGGHGFKATVKAALLGAPLPLCSCGVIPAAVGLRRSGASKAATTSFLVSTPETGVDSVTVSYVLLGPFMAVVRPIAAITSAIVAGMLVGRDEDTVHSTSDISEKTVKSNCCDKEMPPITSCCDPQVKGVSMPKNETSCCPSVKTDTVKKTCCDGDISAEQSTNVDSVVQEGACCDKDSNAQADLPSDSILLRIAKGLHYAATDLVRDTTVWLLIGLLFAALVQTYVPSDFLVQWGDGILAMLVMVVISIPMYICATASTPIAAGLLLAGLSPGAVLVFMLAGPATNIATLGVVSKELGKRALFGYLGGVLGVALIFGMLTNELVDNFGFVVAPQIGEHYALLPSWVVYSSGIILAGLMLKVLFEKLPKNWWRRDCCS
ncbi:SO_0444 family Cu/Zn efflux transporter [uncultured Shewanella sp.]|uniref:SO_0444 family Cu/Zn efflux transporter n=1 Tax=uncultured Shewanella sp. TaxID=173975 RepID=UPI0026171663|nr:SO_0444 family Cu/Zn efflux transporter [uncultured Shewanella sp.]